MYSRIDSASAQSVMPIRLSECARVSDSINHFRDQHASSTFRRVLQATSGIPPSTRHTGSSRRDGHKEHKKIDRCW
jgi:hypothetical protein